ncbi:V-type H+-transporting ATPase 16kDa proteolipid subunit [Enteropsectra breve]|nr:V-type H+-transporting ATPase 16kDa proteolipid subunit [Enteropsectra breve]
MEEQTSFLLGALGICSTLSLAAYGSCSGMAMCGSSSALYAHVHEIISFSYVSMIIISTVFFYAFILAIVMMNKITKDFSALLGLRYLSIGIFFGTVGMVAGRAMGAVSQSGFRKLSKHPSFFTSFLISLASIEVTLVLAFLCSLILLYS